MPILRLVPLVIFVLLVAPARSPAQDVSARMRAWSAALGVTCSHCHVAEAWSDASKPAFAFAQRMSRMVEGLNRGPLRDLGDITCWTCHRGRVTPARLPREQWEGLQRAHAADFASAPDSALAMSVYAASLGVACTHCHEDGDWAAATRPAHAMVARMLPIFDEIPKYFESSRQPRTQCYMCHQGQTTPQRTAPAIGRRDKP